MDELRERVARAIRGAGHPTEGQMMSARRQADRVIKEIGLVQFWAVAYGDGYQPEESYEERAHAQERVDDAIDAGDEDAKLITAWFTGWRDAVGLAPVQLS